MKHTQAGRTLRFVASVAGFCLNNWEVTDDQAPILVVCGEGDAVDYLRLVDGDAVD